MDGVLALTEKADYLSWKHLFAPYGVDLSVDQYKAFLGMK